MSETRPEFLRRLIRNMIRIRLSPAFTHEERLLLDRVIIGFDAELRQAEYALIRVMRYVAVYGPVSLDLYPTQQWAPHRQSDRELAARR